MEEACFDDVRMNASLIDSVLVVIRGVSTLANISSKSRWERYLMASLWLSRNCRFNTMVVHLRRGVVL